MHFLCTTNLITSHRNQPLLLAEWLTCQKKIGQISGTQLVNKWVTTYYFSYNFLKFTKQSFVVIKCDVLYFLCTTNLIITYTNQPLLVVLGGWLEKKNKSNQICNQVGNNEQMSRELHITLYKFFKLIDQFFFVIQ